MKNPITYKIFNTTWWKDSIREFDETKPFLSENEESIENEYDFYQYYELNTLTDFDEEFKITYNNILRDQVVPTNNNKISDWRIMWWIKDSDSKTNLRKSLKKDMPTIELVPSEPEEVNINEQYEYQEDELAEIYKSYLDISTIADKGSLEEKEVYDYYKRYKLVSYGHRPRVLVEIRKAVKQFNEYLYSEQSFQDNPPLNDYYKRYCNYEKFLTLK